MTVTITSNTGDSIAPALVLGDYAANRAVRTVVHTIIGRADPDISYYPVGLRTGSLELFFLTAAPAMLCEQMHATSAIFSLSDSDLPARAMAYVPAGGDISTRSDAATGRWIVTVPYQEVAT